jgi:metacaspase-1
MPLNMVHDTYRINSAHYDQILTRGELRNSERKVKASVMLISGCQENQLSADGESNGLFTSQLLHIWNDGLFKENYKEFRNKIVETMPPDQTPNYFTVGSRSIVFEEQIPFTI